MMELFFKFNDIRQCYVYILYDVSQQINFVSFQLFHLQINSTNSAA